MISRNVLFVISFIIMFFCLLSCSRGQFNSSMGPYHTRTDFSDHWELLGEDFREGQRESIVSLSGPSKKYLRDLIKKIKLGGGPLLEDFKERDVVVVSDYRPFHFSVPNGRIFLSLGLLKKYVEYEGLLASILAIEMIRGHKKIFVKNIMVPTGVVSFDKLRPLLRINPELQSEVNKWAVYTLKRSGFDPLSLLRLLQIKNKNFLDFFVTQNESKNISVERVHLKNFLVNRRLFDDINKVLKNSSRGFYHFINEVKKS